MEKSSFFNSIDGDRKYNAESLANYFSSFIGNGIFPTPSTNLQVLSSNDMAIKLSPGKAWINGYYYQNTDYLILNLDPADGVLNRIDRIVLRLDYLNREIKAYVKKGIFASEPVVQPLQRDADVFELGIADIKISKGTTSISQADITDLRMDNAYCGVVAGVVNQIDTTNLFTQYNEAFSVWFEDVKGQLGEDAAGHLLTLINGVQEQVDTIREDISKLSSSDIAVRQEVVQLKAELAKQNASKTGIGYYDLFNDGSGVAEYHNCTVKQNIGEVTINARGAIEMKPQDFKEELTLWKQEYFSRIAVQLYTEKKNWVLVNESDGSTKVSLSSASKIITTDDKLIVGNDIVNMIEVNGRSLEIDSLFPNHKLLIQESIDSVGIGVHRIQAKGGWDLICHKSLSDTLMIVRQDGEKWFIKGPSQLIGHSWYLFDNKLYVFVEFYRDGISYVEIDLMNPPRVGTVELSGKLFTCDSTQPSPFVNVAGFASAKIDNVVTLVISPIANNIAYIINGTFNFQTKKMVFDSPRQLYVNGVWGGAGIDLLVTPDKRLLLTTHIPSSGGPIRINSFNKDGSSPKLLYAENGGIIESCRIQSFIDDENRPIIFFVATTHQSNAELLVTVLRGNAECTSFVKCDWASQKYYNVRTFVQDKLGAVKMLRNAGAMVLFKSDTHWEQAKTLISDIKIQQPYINPDFLQFPPIKKSIVSLENGTFYVLCNNANVPVLMKYEDITMNPSIVKTLAIPTSGVSSILWMKNNGNKLLISITDKIITYDSDANVFGELNLDASIKSSENIVIENGILYAGIKGTTLGIVNLATNVKVNSSPAPSTVIPICWSEQYNVLVCIDNNYKLHMYNPAQNTWIVGNILTNISNYGSAEMVGDKLYVVPCVGGFKHYAYRINPNYNATFIGGDNDYSIESTNCITVDKKRNNVIGFCNYSRSLGITGAISLSLFETNDNGEFVSPSFSIWGKAVLLDERLADDPLQSAWLISPKTITSCSMFLYGKFASGDGYDVILDRPIQLTKNNKQTILDMFPLQRGRKIPFVKENDSDFEFASSELKETEAEITIEGNNTTITKLVYSVG